MKYFIKNLYEKAIQKFGKKPVININYSVFMLKIFNNIASSHMYIQGTKGEKISLRLEFYTFVIKYLLYCIKNSTN